MRIRVDVRSNLGRLLAQEDTDGDRKITVDDTGSKRFDLESVDGRSFEVSGTYYLSNLLQELVLAGDVDVATIDSERIFEPPSERISRSIRDDYWTGLTRRVDEAHLREIVTDEKATAADGMRHLYVPSGDAEAFAEFTAIAARHPDWNISVERLPEAVTPRYVRQLDGRHGLLALATTRTVGGGREGVPFVVPGGRFNELYGWDSYFIVLGLLHDGKLELARAMVDNHVYEITHYGAILNANRTYYLTRSQPPFLTSMALAVFDRLPRDEASRAWLATALRAAAREYREVWMGPAKLTDTGLSRYRDSGYGAPPEVEPGHFDVALDSFARDRGMSRGAFESAYRSGAIEDPALDEYFVHDRAMRESGHDTSYRLEGRCANLVTVDLNALLYKIESDLAAALEGELVGAAESAGVGLGTSDEWRRAAEARRAMVDRYLWSADDGLYFDYDVVARERTGFVSATTLYPLWAGIASDAQAADLVRRAFPLLEEAGGIVGSTESSRGPITPDRPLRQWDFPHGWAPHQMLAWQGLRNYGFDDIARRIAYRWLYTITVNAANYNGTVPEKFDLVTRSHQVFAEYGNVGAEFDYITREGFGWTNASYQIGLDLLTPELRNALDRLVAPEWLFEPEKRT